MVFSPEIIFFFEKLDFEKKSAAVKILVGQRVILLVVFFFFQHLRSYTGGAELYAPAFCVHVGTLLTSFVDFFLFVFVFDILLCLCLAALWSPAERADL